MASNTTLEKIKQRNPHEPEFLQAAQEVIASVQPVLKRNPKYEKFRILERMLEPERIISFRVVWLDDAGQVQVNRGYRVQMNSAIGPYKGGLRFHPSVNPSILKFLGYEQVFKNALTGIPLGGGKGGSNFDPKGKSENEIMRFCQAFMGELSKHIHHRLDVPAGDIGVGAREIGFLFGAYKKIKNEFTGTLTGKGQEWGGSLLRPEATGYGLIYFAENMLQSGNDSIAKKTCLVSGSGNVAQHTIEKIIQLGGKVISASDSSGFIHDPNGISSEKLAFLKRLKNKRRGRIKEYSDEFSGVAYHATDRSLNYNPLWSLKANCAFPCATQNEIGVNDAHNLVQGGVQLVAEGANMPISPEGIDVLLANNVMYAPGKASNAGGVATSGLEMSQNYMGQHWKKDEVDKRLHEIMKNIHDTCLNTAEGYGVPGNYMVGANIAGFVKVADAMIAQGVL